MYKIIEKFAIVLVCLLLATMAAGLFKGVPSALSAVVMGEMNDSPFASLALVLMGWVGGFAAGRERPSSAGVMRLPQLVATLLFFALLLWFRRFELGTWEGLMESAPAILVALTIWLFVVVGPWIAAAESKAQQEN